MDRCDAYGLFMDRCGAYLWICVMLADGCGYRVRCEAVSLSPHPSIGDYLSLSLSLSLALSLSRLFMDRLFMDVGVALADGCGYRHASAMRDGVALAAAWR